MPAGVIGVSSGNHAQALALAARTVGLPAVILIPFDASPAKVAATRGFGAEVIQDGITFENREERVRQVMAERGLRSEEHTSELQSLRHLVCRLLLEKK